MSRIGLLSECNYWFHIFILFQHLAFWLSSLKHSLDHVAKTGKFPKPQNVARNPDGTLRVQVSPADYFTWAATGFSTLELHIENPRSRHASDLSPTKSSVLEAISGIPLEPEQQPVDEIAEISDDVMPELDELQHQPSELYLMRGGEVAAVLGAGNCKLGHSSDNAPFCTIGMLLLS